MKDIFLIITADKYPNGDAGAIREHAFAKIFEKIGYTPVVIGIGESTNFNKKVYDGVHYYSVRYTHNNLICRIMGRLFFLHNVKKIFRDIPKNEIRGILVVSGGIKTFKHFEKVAKRYNVQLFHDSVEWYSPSEFAKGEKDPSYKSNNKLNTQIIDDKYKVFAISRFLKNAFVEKNINVLRIPVIMDVQNINSAKHTTRNSKIKITYAGQVGGKDHLQEVIQAIESMDEKDSSKIQFKLIGITQEQYESKFGKVKEHLIGETILFMGRITREQVLKELQETNFTILLRPEKERYAMAGFPTKVVESLSTATPVICNYTSDLVLYLKNGYNSIVIDECSSEACRKGLERILQLSSNDLQVMQNNARKTAEDCFDWRIYVDCVEQFVDQ